MNYGEALLNFILVLILEFAETVSSVRLFFTTSCFLSLLTENYQICQRHCLCKNFRLSTSNDPDPSKYATLFFRIHNENSPSETTHSKKGTSALKNVNSTDMTKNPSVE
jgi:hypothetical protein